MFSETITGSRRMSSKIVDLYPSARNEGEGTLVVGGRGYRVSVLYEKGRRLWARVTVSAEIDDESRRRNAFYEIAHRGMSDASWRPLCVDPSDGETTYSTTITSGISEISLDEFLSSAREFLEQNGHEVSEIVGDVDSSSVGDGDDGLDILSMLLDGNH